MSNFSPGPYCVTEDGFVRQTDDAEGHRLFIASIVEVPFNFGGNKTTEANLNLLSAATEMYEALKLARAEMIASGNWYAKDYKWPEACQRVDAALAKADGRAQ